MKFPYQEFGPHYRPVVPVTLKYGRRSYQGAALVDSGSDMCLFSVEIAHALGIPLSVKNQHTVGGVSGIQRESFRHRITIKVGNSEYKTKVGFLSNVSGSFDYGILGQVGFFDRFVVGFDFKKKEIQVR